MEPKFSIVRDDEKTANYAPPVKDVNAGVEFADRPVRCTCPHCNRSVVTQVETSHNSVSILLFFVLFIFFSFVTLCIYPFVCGLFKDAVHTCPRCWGLINKNRRFRMPVVSREIITLRCGDCAVVLSKKYVYGCAAILVLVGSFSMLRWYLRNIGLPDVSEGPDIPATWSDFHAQCGSRTSLGNPIHRNAIFDQEYFSKTVTWEGRLNRVEEGFFQKNFLFVNMDPHQAPRPEVPDIALVYSAREFNDEVAQLEVGDLIRFRATLLALGARASPHVGVLRFVEKLRSASELPDLFGPPTGFGYINQAPIAHLPKLARKVVEARNEFVNNRLNASAPVAFFVGDEIIAAPKQTAP